MVSKLCKLFWEKIGMGFVIDDEDECGKCINVRR